VRLCLVQHGLAKTEEEDPERPLTDQGVTDVRSVATQAVEQLGVRAARVFHSGKTRARQTAEVWAGLLGALVLVGHLPHLSRLAGLLLAGADHPLVKFRPAGVVGLERGDTGWVVWLVLPPRGS